MSWRTEGSVLRGVMEIEILNIVQGLRVGLWAKVEDMNGGNHRRGGKFKELRGHGPFSQLDLLLWSFNQSPLSD